MKIKHWTATFSFPPLFTKYNITENIIRYPLANSSEGQQGGQEGRESAAIPTTSSFLSSSMASSSTFSTSCFSNSFSMILEMCRMCARVALGSAKCLGRFSGWAREVEERRSAAQAILHMNTERLKVLKRRSLISILSFEDQYSTTL